MKKMLLFFCLLCLLFSIVEAATEILPVSEIKPGMRGITYTVMQGTEIVPLETEILGVLENGIAPGFDMIIGRLTDPKSQLTGAVHGMSGSPLYIDGKLVGALSRRLMIFEKDGHCGFTPIEDMLDVGKRKNRPKYELKEKLAFQDLGKVAPEGTSFRGQSLCIPLSITGWKDSWGGTFEKIAAGWKNVFVPVAGGSGLRSQMIEYPLKPGSAVAAVLVSGDISIAGTGTLTWMEGEKVLAFGHPMMESGAVAYPMAGAQIITIVPSYYTPHKLSNTGKIVGQIDQDRLSAISGTVGKFPKMASYEIARLHEGEVRKVWKGGMIRDPRLLPQILSMLYMVAIDGAQDFSQDFTMELTSSLQFKGLPLLKLSHVYSGERGIMRILGLYDQIHTVFGILSPFANEIELESVKLNVATRESSHVWNLVKVHVPVQEVQQGAKVKIIPVFKNLDGEFKEMPQEITVPEEIKEGSFILRVTCGNYLQQKQRWRTNIAPETKPKDAIDAMNRSYNYQAFYVELITPNPGYVENTREQENVPFSVLEILRGGRRKAGASILTENVRSRVEVKMDGVVWGSNDIEMSIIK